MEINQNFHRSFWSCFWWYSFPEIFHQISTIVVEFDGNKHEFCIIKSMIKKLVGNDAKKHESRITESIIEKLSEIWWKFSGILYQQKHDQFEHRKMMGKFQNLVSSKAWSKNWWKIMEKFRNLVSSKAWSIWTEENDGKIPECCIIKSMIKNLVENDGKIPESCIIKIEHHRLKYDVVE